MRTLRLVLATLAAAITFGFIAPYVGGAGAAPPQGSTSDSVPQPFSNADQNNTGANDTSSGNQYVSTRNGSPSLNGSGTGNATGKPCAGCVGKADNKNPPGQYPNGSDPNNGYECDGNNGIGQTNPAHTGCVPASTTTTEAGGSTTTTSTQPGEGGGTTTTTTTDTGGENGSTTTTTGPATNGGGGSGDLGKTSGQGGSNSPQVIEQKLTQWMNPSSAPATRAASGSGAPLAFTGMNVVRYVLAALLSLLVGAILYVLEPRMRARILLGRQ